MYVEIYAAPDTHHTVLEGPVNDGYTLMKRQLNFSITGPSCTAVYSTTTVYVYDFLKHELPWGHSCGRRLRKR
jgi:hypothetical protein